MSHRRYHFQGMGVSDITRRYNVAVEPCPFCRSGNVGLYLGPSPHMTCLDCGADGPLPETRMERDWTNFAAVELWNQRS